MLKLLFFLLFPSVCLTSAFAQHALNYYLPKGVQYDPGIPEPKEVIGHDVGEWHVTHDKLVHYMKTLAEASNRMIWQEYGRTYEHRELGTLTITASDNLRQLDRIKEQHKKRCDPKQSSQGDIATAPIVIYLGYSIHGNEASGSNAAMLAAYHLAAGQGDSMDNLLKNAVIILDPSFNPDGLTRFATWVNSRKSYHVSADPFNAEQNEFWPRGRTNHYWFDINRDWLPSQLPESQGRLKVFHDWKPNLLTDHHEMGTNSTFFFQPGIPSRNNPLTPENNYRLTAKLGEYHARALDKIGSLYYTQESFDDYYLGKASAYPDVNGGVGILFEQASPRGHAQESTNGMLTFPFAIRNHFTVTLSTLQGALDLRRDFLQHQRDFYTSAIRAASSDPIQGIIFGSQDKMKAFHLAELVERHQIEIFNLSKTVQFKGESFQPGESYVIPLEQPQYRLIKAMFEKRTSFQDSLFYDVSTWTLPLAFGLNYADITTRAFSRNLLGEKFDPTQMPKGKVIGGKSSYAYAFEWHGYYAPRALYRLLDQELRAKVANEVFYQAQGKRFALGSIVVPVQNQKTDPDGIHHLMQQIADEDGIDVYALETGLDYKGVSLGSPSFSSLRKPKVALLVEGGVTAYDAGEVWHLFDQRFDIDLTLLPIRVFAKADLQRYNTLIMVNGNYHELNATARVKLKDWVQNGGVIVASKSALSWLNSNGMGNFETKKRSNKRSSRQRRYADIAEFRGAQRVGGSIFQVRADLTHPLVYGYDKNLIYLFKNGDLFLESSSKSYGNPITYTENPLVSGYISEENLELIKGSPAVGISALGRGRVIGFADNLNFRAFWYGTNKMFLNAVFFGNIMHEAAVR